MDVPYLRATAPSAAQTKMMATARSAQTLLRIGFVMTTEAGLRAQYINWRASECPEWKVEAEWIIPEWWREGGFIERLPALPRKLKSHLSASWQVRRRLLGREFDALFLATLSLFREQRLLLDRQPYFVTMDSTQSQQSDLLRDQYGKRPSRLRGFEIWKRDFERHALREARGLFPWSRWAQESLIQDYGVDPDRVHVIPPGLDLTRWQAPDRSCREGPVRILFVGGFFYQKGGDLLLDWALQTSRADWELHLVTRDPVRSPRPNVFVHNGLSSSDPTLIRLYREADMFVLPTRADCYGLASVEALAAGLPVVVSLTGGSGDVVREGETGFLVPCGDDRAVAERVEFLLDDPDRRVSMGMAARRDAEARYDARRNTAQIINLMRQSIGDGGAVARAVTRPGAPIPGSCGELSSV